MSSLRVRAQNKLLNSLGAAKPSKNVQFDFAYSGFEQTQAGIVELEAALRSYIICLKGYHLSAQSLVRVIDNVGGNPENTPTTKQFASEIKSAFVQLDGHLLNDSVKRFEQRVLNLTVGWLSRGHALKQQIAAYNEEKLLYDHYTRKVMALRDARDKRAGAGKAEKPKDVDKLVRNEQKYAAITNSYSKISDQTIASLREFVSSREDTLTPILHRMLEFRVKYAKQVHDESQKLQPLIKTDAKYESILGQLEMFVGRLVGGSAAATPPSDNANEARAVAASAAESDVPVQSFSFASFVGEAPPAVPTESYDPMKGSGNSSRASSFATSQSPPSPLQPLSSPSSPDGFFFDDFAATSSSMAPLSLDFQPPPPPPPQLPSAPESSGAGAWDTFPPKPAAAPPLSAAAFSTMPAASSTTSSTSPAALATSWGAFDDLTPPVTASGNPFQFETNFANLHQSALGGNSTGDDESRGVSGSVSF